MGDNDQGYRYASIAVALPLLDHAVQIRGAARYPASRRVRPIMGWSTRRAISNAPTRHGHRHTAISSKELIPLGSASGQIAYF